MALFDVPKRAGRESDLKIAKKTKTAKSNITVRGGNGIVERINTIRAMVEKNLGVYRDDYIVIQSEDNLYKYITNAIANGVISIDTETTGLDPLKDEIVGICIYTPGMPAAYIPVHHKSYITMAEVENQLPVDIIKQQFNRLNEQKTDVIMFNACFDIRFLRNRIGVYLTCTWDCYLATRLLNENEPSNALKLVHKKYVLDNKEDAFKFDDLFKGVSFDLIPINTAYLYAAHDAIITYELYQFQKPFLTPDNSVCEEHELKDVAWVFHNIEMPCIEVIADMEDVGVDFDMAYADKLHEEYHKQLREKTERCYKILDMYSNDIETYKSKNVNHKLSDPINLDSPTQIAILLYDVMKIKPVDNDKPRGTGEEILKKINTDFTEALLDYRGVGKLINTYIDKLPLCVNEKDGRIHCKFNQYGADTGRMSSSDPNLQNIPSHNKDIRKLFKATTYEKFVECENNIFTVHKWCTVETESGFISAQSIKVGDILITDSGKVVVKNISKPVDNNQYLCYHIAERG